MAGRVPRPRTDHPCDDCGAGVPVVVGDVPPGPLWCDACRPAHVPNPAPTIRTTCSLFGCDNEVRIVGRRRRPYELGRPIFCSRACWLTTTQVTRPCRCGKPITVNVRALARGDGLYCSRECSTDAQRNPGRRCARCREMFHSKRPRARYCSRRCGSRGAKRPEQLLRTCPVCGKQELVHPDRVRRPCSKACSNSWRWMPGWEPATRGTPVTRKAD